MAGDMVASVTLRLRDQMSAGVDEIKRQFNSVQETLDRLTGVLGDLQKTLDGLRMPARVNAALASTVAEAGEAAKAVASIGKAATDSAAMMRGLEIPAFPTQIHNPAIPDEFQVPFAPGSKGRRALSAGGATEVEDGPGSIENAHVRGADYLTDAVMGAIAATMGLDSIKAYGNFDAVLRQTAIVEHLHGKAAKGRIRELTDFLDRIALKDRQSSQALAETYYWMITTGIPHGEVNALLPWIAKVSTAHNTSPMLMGMATFAAYDDFKIPAAKMGDALEALADAAKMAHFSIENFGQYLKEIGGVTATAKMYGRHNLDVVAAGLETVVKNSSQPNQAAANYRDFVIALSSVQTHRAFDQLQYKRQLMALHRLISVYHLKPVHIGVLENEAATKGENPVTAVLDYLHKVMKPMTATDRAEYLTAMFGGQQAAMLAKSVFLHWKQYNAMIGQLDKAGQAGLTKDFNTSMHGAATQLTLFDENMAEVNRGIGHSLLPVLKVITGTVTAIEGAISPRAPKGLTPAQKLSYYSNEYDVGTPVYQSKSQGRPDGTSRLHEAVTAQTQAVRDNTQAMRDGHALQNYMHAHPASPNATPPQGPFLNRP